MKVFKLIYFLFFISCNQSCSAQVNFGKTNSDQFNILLERIDSNMISDEIFNELDIYIQENVLNGVQARMMSEKLFYAKKIAGYDLLTKYNAKFQRHPSRNASEIIEGKVFIIHSQIPRLGIKVIRPFADYIYNSQLNRKLDKNEFSFFKKALTNFLDDYYNKFQAEKGNISSEKADNLKRIFSHFENK